MEILVDIHHRIDIQISDMHLLLERQAVVWISVLLVGNHKANIEEIEQLPVRPMIEIELDDVWPCDDLWSKISDTISDRRVGAEVARVIAIEHLDAMPNGDILWQCSRGVEHPEHSLLLAEEICDRVVAEQLCCRRGIEERHAEEQQISGQQRQHSPL